MWTAMETFTTLDFMGLGGVMGLNFFETLFRSPYLKDLVERFQRTPRLQPSEPLARFLLTKGHFYRERSAVHRKAFVPDKDNTVSVFRVQGLPEAKIRELAIREISSGRGLTIYGRAQLSVQDASPPPLRVLPSPPPPRHASIEGWPVNNKDALMDLQNVLASASELILD